MSEIELADLWVTRASVTESLQTHKMLMGKVNEILDRYGFVPEVAHVRTKISAAHQRYQDLLDKEGLTSH